jgi:DNA-binding LytR/AlgR family response regulator
MLENIRTLFNSRLEGTLINGEKITISRTYIPAIRAAFAEKGN